MKPKHSNITIHMVTSLDGFIASPDNDVAWMQSTDHYEQGIELTADEITDFLASINCYVMGSRTYEHACALGWPYGDTPVFVLTSRELSSDRASVRFLSGDLTDIVNQQLRPHYNNIWVVGGAMLANAFLKSGLADAINITVMPILLGSGTRFFDEIGTVYQLHLKDVTAFRDGMVEMWYAVRREEGTFK